MGKSEIFKNTNVIRGSKSNIYQFVSDCWSALLKSCLFHNHENIINLTKHVSSGPQTILIAYAPDSTIPWSNYTPSLCIGVSRTCLSKVMIADSMEDEIHKSWIAKLSASSNSSLSLEPRWLYSQLDPPSQPPTLSLIHLATHTPTLKGIKLKRRFICVITTN